MHKGGVWPIYSPMRWACKLLILTLLPAVVACASPLAGKEFEATFDKATAAYDAGDYKTARRHWQVLADNFDLAAMRNLGHLYRKGLGVARNAQKAHDYYHAAATRGFAPAQYNLARMYLAGDGIERDAEKGMGWLRRAAGQGFKPAADYLHLMTLKFEPFNG